MTWLKVILAAEFLGLIGGTVLFAFWKRTTDNPRIWLILLAVGLVSTALVVTERREASDRTSG